MLTLAERGQEIFNLKPPSKQTQREKIIWMQHNRTSGTWAKCCVHQCQKWRYLKNIFDPIDIPNEWQCSMNPDPEYNSCSKPQSRDFKDIAVIKVKYTAGSLVWVNSARYLRWPGMVDDDPELAQFYWLSYMNRDREACMYHVVFIDRDTSHVSRQWFSEHELEVFSLSNSEVVPGKQVRLIESVRLAREALKLNIFQRLQRFSFARLFRGHIFSCGHKMRSLIVSEGFDPGSDSDCTLLSTYSDDEIDENYRSRSRHFGDCFENNSRKRRGSSLAPRSDYSNNGSKRSRFSSLAPSDRLDIPRGKRSSSLAPSDYSDYSPGKRSTWSVPCDYFPENLSGRRRRASSLSRGGYSDSSSRERRASSRGSCVDYSENKSQRKRASAITSGDGYPQNLPRSRASSISSGDYSDTNSRKRRAPSRVPCDSYSENKSQRKRASSVAPGDGYSVNKSQRKRASSIAPGDGYSENKSPRKRAASIAPGDGYSEYKSPRKRAASIAPGDGYSENKSQRRRASSIAPGDICKPKSRNKRSPLVMPSDQSENIRRTTSFVSNYSGLNPRGKRGIPAGVGKHSEHSLRQKSGPSVARQYSEASMRQKRGSTVPREYSEPSLRKKSGSTVIREYSEPSLMQESDSTVPNNYSGRKWSRPISTGDTSGRILRSHTRSNFEAMCDVLNVGYDERSKIMPSAMLPNEMFYNRENAFHLARNLPSSHNPPLLNIPRKGLVKKTVLKLTTTNWRFSTSQDLYKYISEPI